MSGRYPAPVPPFCAGCRAVGLDDGTVDEEQTIAGVLGKAIEDRLPYAAPRPAGIAVIDRGARAVTLGQVAPRGAGCADYRKCRSEPAGRPPASGPVRRSATAARSPLILRRINQIS